MEAKVKFLTNEDLKALYFALVQSGEIKYGMAENLVVTKFQRHQKLCLAALNSKPD